MNSKEAIRKRLIKYLVPVILLSITFNLPKFMEAQVIYVLPKEFNYTRFDATINETRQVAFLQN